jgi:hypothetical protein
MARRLRDMTEPELRHYMELVAAATESVMPEGPGRNGKALFVLLVFDDPGLVQYVANCDRADVIQALRETADRLESREDIPR